MLRYELIEHSDEYVSYRYYPEGKAPYGTVTIRKYNKEIIRQEIAPDDDFHWYLWHLVQKIEQFIDACHFDEQGTIAWY